MNDYDTPADLAKAMRDQLGRPPSELAQHLTSTARLNVIELWPELFVEVSDVDAQAIQDACVASWHEGWEPNRADVEDMAAKARGEIDHDELLRRARQRARCVLGVLEAAGSGGPGGERRYRGRRPAAGGLDRGSGGGCLLRRGPGDRYGRDERCAGKYSEGACTFRH